MAGLIFVHFIICLKGKNINKYWTLNNNENAEVLRGKEKNCPSWSCHVQQMFKWPTSVLGCSQCSLVDHMSGDIVEYTGCPGKQVKITLLILKSWWQRWLLDYSQEAPVWFPVVIREKNPLILVGSINVNAFWNLNKPCFYSFTLVSISCSVNLKQPTKLNLVNVSFFSKMHSLDLKVWVRVRRVRQGPESAALDPVI